MTWIDAVIIFAFIAYSVSAGFRSSRLASQNLEEYFLAGRTLSGWKAGVSMAATQYAADTPLLVAGLVATAGMFALWRLWIYAIAFLFLGFVLGASWRRAGILTDAELTELRYSGRAAFWLRALKAVYFGTVINCTVLAMVLTAAARIAEPFLPWHEWLPPGAVQAVAGLMERLGFLLTARAPDDPMAWIYSANNFISIGIIVVFTWLYSTTGGLRSVVATDVVQFAIMMLATAVYAAYVLHETGGFTGLISELKRLYSAEHVRKLLSFGPVQWDQAAQLFAAVLAVQWFAQISADGSGYLAQRSMACRNDHETRVAGVTFAFAQVLLRSLLWLPIILGLLVIYPAAELQMDAASEVFRVEREAAFAWGIRDLLPSGVRGLMLTGMLAALASTVDTHLNWGASYWSNDLYKRVLMEKMLKREPGSRELVWVARLSNALILLLALLVAFNLSSVQSAWHLSLLVGSGVGVVLILRWVWHRVNVYSEIAACAASLVLSPVLLFGFPDMPEGAQLLWMTAGTTLAVLAATLLTPPEPQETLLAFYRRARPWGSWGKIARAAGDETWPESKLRRGIAATAAASASLFLLLAGAGQAMVSAGQGGLWGPPGLIFAGLALVPVWVRLGFRPERDASRRNA